MRANIELLEGRRLLTVLTAGNLLVSGTSGNDTIQIALSGSNIDAIVNGDTQSFAQSDVQSIEIHGDTGDDSISISTDITTAANITGDAGNDTIIAGAGNETLDGGDGNDTLDYSARTDAITGGSGQFTTGLGVDRYSNFETLLCGSGNDQIGIYTFGGSNTDTIEYIDGGAGNDSLVYDEQSGNITPTVHGGDGNDTLEVDRRQGFFDGIVTSGGPAYYYGDAGDDTFRMSRDEDSRNFFGGDGIDSVDYSEFSTAGGMHFSLDDQQNDGPGGNDNIHSDVEIIHGGPWSDTIIGSSHDETLYGGAGGDLIIGGGGNDSLVGTQGSDTLEGDAGDDTLVGNGGIDTFNSDSDDSIVNSAAILRGSTLSVSGTNGDDVINVQLKPADAATLQVIVNGTTSEFALSQITEIDIAGYKGNDRISVDSAVTVRADLDGGDGNDTLSGGGGQGSLVGQAGNDLLMNNDGEYQIVSDSSDVVIQGGPGGSTSSLVNHILRVNGTAGNDQIIVRPGTTSSANFDVVINGITQNYLRGDISLIQVDGGSGDDHITIDASIQLATKLYGGAGNDIIIGGGGSDRIMGGDGNDWVSGGAGNDVIYGEAGNDRIFGGDGRDYIVGGSGTNLIRGEAGVDHIIADSLLDDIRGNRGDQIEI
jgi:Ca2+-binding RTX toxin-like protein